MAVVACDILQLFRLAFVVFLERVEPLRLDPVASDLVKDFNFVESRHEIVASRSLNFQRDIRVVLNVLGKPYC